jgi:SAM-dependent methyltransferase
MNLLDLVSRQPPRPWVDGEKIPWDEPGFSARMLREHLSQQHDAASRRFATIDRHVAWIHQHVLGGEPARILDLGCGPGLYLSRLARLGHRGTGIDFSPASIAYARTAAEAAALPISYRQEDLRRAEFAAADPGYDLAMLLYGEFNTFRDGDAAAILTKALAALRPGGRLLLEPSTFAYTQALGAGGPRWYAAPNGLWSDRPHLCLQDNAWDAEQGAVVERYTLIDAESGAITQHAMTTRAYQAEEVTALLAGSGFVNITHYPSLLGVADAEQAWLYAVLADKPN